MSLVHRHQQSVVGGVASWSKKDVEGVGTDGVPAPVVAKSPRYVEMPEMFNDDEPAAGDGLGVEHCVTRVACTLPCPGVIATW